MECQFYGNWNFCFYHNIVRGFHSDNCWSLTYLNTCLPWALYCIVLYLSTISAVYTFDRSDIWFWFCASILFHDSIAKLSHSGFLFFLVCHIRFGVWCISFDIWLRTLDIFIVCNCCFTEQAWSSLHLWVRLKSVTMAMKQLRETKQSLIPSIRGLWICFCHFMLRLSWFLVTMMDIWIKEFYFGLFNICAVYSGIGEKELLLANCDLFIIIIYIESTFCNLQEQVQLIRILLLHCIRFKRVEVLSAFTNAVSIWCFTHYCSCYFTFG